MKQPVSFKLSTQVFEKLNRMARISRMSKTAILETLIERADAIEPIITSTPPTLRNKKRRTAQQPASASN